MKENVMLHINQERFDAKVGGISVRNTSVMLKTGEM